MCPLPNWRNSITAPALHARSSPATRRRSPTGCKRWRSARGRWSSSRSNHIRQFVALQYRAIGDPKRAIAMFVLDRAGWESARRARHHDQRSVQHRGERWFRWKTSPRQAPTRAASERSFRRRGGVRIRIGVPPTPSTVIRGKPRTNSVHGLVLEARGQYPEAEAAYRRAEAFSRAAVKDIPKFDFPPPLEQVTLAADYEALRWVARNETKQGRLSEAETDFRRALLSVLKQQGKYAPVTPAFIVGLAGILVEQGRYQEAGKLAPRGTGRAARACSGSTTTNLCKPGNETTLASIEAEVQRRWQRLKAKDENPLL